MDRQRIPPVEEKPRNDVEHPAEEDAAHPTAGYAAGRCAVPESVREEEQERPDNRSEP